MEEEAGVLAQPNRNYADKVLRLRDFTARSHNAAARNKTRRAPPLMSNAPMQLRRSARIAARTRHSEERQRLRFGGIPAPPTPAPHNSHASSNASSPPLRSSPDATSSTDSTFSRIHALSPARDSNAGQSPSSSDSFCDANSSLPPMESPQSTQSNGTEVDEAGPSATSDEPDSNAEDTADIRISERFVFRTTPDVTEQASPVRPQCSEDVSGLRGRTSCSEDRCQLENIIALSSERHRLTPRNVVEEKKVYFSKWWTRVQKS